VVGLGFAVVEKGGAFHGLDRERFVADERVAGQGVKEYEFVKPVQLRVIPPAAYEEAPIVLLMPCETFEDLLLRREAYIPRFVKELRHQDDREAIPRQPAQPGTTIGGQSKAPEHAQVEHVGLALQHIE